MCDIIIISYATMHTVLVPAACTDNTIYNLLKRLDSSTLRETMAREAVYWNFRRLLLPSFPSSLGCIIRSITVPGKQEGAIACHFEARD